MKYNLIRKITEKKDIDSELLEILSDDGGYHCDSILHTDDRIILRYVGVVLSNQNGYIKDKVLYIHFSKQDHMFTKICIYKLVEFIDEKDIQEKI